MKPSDLYVVVWINNKCERGFEVCTVGELLGSNREIFFFDRGSTESDQLVLAVEETKDAAQARLAEFQALRDQAKEKERTPKHDAYHCPKCQRVLYNRRLTTCGFCGSPVPEEMRFTPEEIAAMDQQMAEFDKQRRERQLAVDKEEEEARQRAGDAGTHSGLM